MREIKFRAWDKACDVMLIPEDPNRWVMHGNGCSAIDGVWATVDLELMQYTGLKDKNGVEIYEGDILGRAHQVVYFDDGKFCMMGGEEWGWIDTSLEVIGNIYENPELLE